METNSWEPRTLRLHQAEPAPQHPDEGHSCPGREGQLTLLRSGATPPEEARGHGETGLQKEEALSLPTLELSQAFISQGSI